MIGVVSHREDEVTEDCKAVCLPGTQSWFTRTVSFLDWIYRNMENPTLCWG